MSVYFVHLFSVLLPLACISALLSFNLKNLLNIFLALFLGFLFGYFAFFIANLNLQSGALGFGVDILLLFLLVFALPLFFLQKKGFFYPLALFYFFVLSLAFGVKYFILSVDFPLFSNFILDNESIYSLGFVLLALCLCVCLFFFLRFSLLYNKFASVLFLVLILLCEFDEALANALLFAMRQGFIDTHSLSLSFVAKSLYYAKFIPYLYLFFVLFLALLCLNKRAKNCVKKQSFDNEFKAKKGKNLHIKHFVSFCLVSVILALTPLIYFNLVASKPISIDEPKEVVPNENDVFEFDIELLRDNALHRFAYVTSEGRVVRFFLLNKREDRDSPVAVFDACMICGDLGYIKRGGELICISCNVRIFLPSVGKEGGCNPIPLNYEFDGQKIRIALEEILKGSGYFSQFKKIEVKDPVSGARLINLEAPYSYAYAGFTYYFENEQNYKIFRDEPEKYITHKIKAKQRIQGY